MSIRPQPLAISRSTGASGSSGSRIGVLAAILASGLALTPAHAGRTCEAPTDVVHLAGATPTLRAAFADRQPLRIVAFGSSSTAGAGASRREHAYPARLESTLRERFPGHSVTVLNKGSGGELSTDMLARLERDVIAERPTLVVWQTGVNDAIRNVPVIDFARTVEIGIARIRAAGSDVVLIDQQLYPLSGSVPGYATYIETMRQIGARLDVPVFRRHRLMAHLVASAQYRVEDLLAADRFHQNDVSYACLAEVLADAISRLISHPRAAAAGNLRSERAPTHALSVPQ
ncbi:MAG: SGNH/GDSL hydrolase family protein [Hyphomicrobiaceae bacterium]|nr:SGNH/GDSL hydrolase family protein [Hyphomicrobiaceae bacterium]